MEPIKLEGEEIELRHQIEERVIKARNAYALSRLDDPATGQGIIDAGKFAHQLHMKLLERGHEPKHHHYMIKNRGMEPTHPEFYEHFHPLEDLIKFLDNPSANDDPIDQTIGKTFKFKVVSRRWGSADEYTLKRTLDGWYVSHMAINGSCDKGGRPYLFENLKHDSIQYPVGLDGLLEWLWEQARDKGMSEIDVQKEMTALADWVTNTENSMPSSGIWEEY